uniref:Uncharacterized protein n=1 Tax=Tetradesmus obliquus TaxID=3088 RepID=A0A383W8N9_TETOB|eukprot:jgi/Sobl393_1/2864/SZX73998.1
MFSKFTCLVDPSLDCRLSHEFSSPPRPLAEKGFPANAWDNKNYCFGCFLYFAHCTQKDGSMNTGTLAFVHNSKSPTLQTEHSLVMPNQPCRGIEVWQNRRCGGETAWDASLKRYTDAGGKVADYFGYVVSVNSMEKRTQHQLHMHVGLTPKEVKDALKAGHTWAKGKTSSYFIFCSKQQNQAISCNFDPNKQTKATNTIAVTIAAGTTPSAVTPFMMVYGKNSLPPSDATIKNSMGVVASANNEWLILTLLRGAAECLLESESGPKSSTLITC